MPRVNEKTKNSAGKPYDCNKCEVPIKAGDKYYQWTFYRCRPSRQHVTCGYPRSSQLTNSKLSGAYAAAEALGDAIALAHKAKDLSGIVDEIDTAISDLESVRDEYQESLDNMGENLAQGDTGQQIQENIDALEEYINNLESAKSDIETAEAEVAEAIAEEPEGTEPGDSEDSEPEQDNAVSTALDELESIVGEYSF